MSEEETVSYAFCLAMASNGSGPQSSLASLGARSIVISSDAANVSKMEDDTKRAHQPCRSLSLGKATKVTGWSQANAAVRPSRRSSIANVWEHELASLESRQDGEEGGGR